MQANLFNEIIERFYSKGKIKFYFLFLFSFVSGLFEFMGLILIFQFVLFLTNSESKYSKNIILFFLDKFNLSDISKISLILGILIALIYIVKNIYMLIFTKFSDNLLQDLNQNIILKIIKHFLFQDFLKINEITNDEKMNILSKVSFVVWEYCYKYINLIANCSVGVILIGCLFCKFTLVALCSTLFLGFLAYIEYKYLKNNSTYQDKHYSICLSKFENILNKTILNIKEIRLNNLEDEFISKIAKNSEDCARLNKNRNFCSILHIYFTEISIMLTFALVLIVFYFTIGFDNKALIGSICAICVIVLRLTPVINRVQSCLYALNSNKCLVSEIINFDKRFKDNDFSTTKEILKLNNYIKLKDVCFSFDDNKTGLKNINLEIKKGDFIGIVGINGSYKTTLSLIISGLLKPQNGEIIVDDKILEKEDYKKWQNNVALLSQDYSILFDDNNDFSEAFREYFDKLDLKNKKLNNVSYGEKQRMALANVLSKEKEILILDEISSSSDVLSQEKIIEILENLKGKKTIISIAHRFQILKNCNKIIYLDDGKVIDISTFKKLSEKYPLLRKMIELSNFEA